MDQEQKKPIKKEKISIYDEKPREVLLYLIKNKIVGGEHGYSTYASRIYKNLNCTYTWLLAILDFFEEKGIIKTIRGGRIKYLKLTELGQFIATRFLEIDDAIQNPQASSTP